MMQGAPGLPGPSQGLAGRQEGWGGRETALTLTVYLLSLLRDENSKASGPDLCAGEGPPG